MVIAPITKYFDSDNSYGVIRIKYYTRSFLLIIIVILITQYHFDNLRMASAQTDKNRAVIKKAGIEKKAHP